VDLESASYAIEVKTLIERLHPRRPKRTECHARNTRTSHRAGDRTSSSDTGRFPTPRA
jgi:hypothetical protein